MTIIEKIIADHCGKKRVVPGEIVWAKVDLGLANDVTAPLAIEEFKKAGFSKVFSKEKIVLVPDHFVPARDVKSANQAKMMKEFAKEQGIIHYFELGRGGIEHILVPDEGLVSPGEIIIGADSHTCTYGALSAFSTGIGSTDFAAFMATGYAWFKVPKTIRVSFSGKRRKWVFGKDLILYLIGKIGVEGALYRALEFGGDGISNLNMADRFTISNMAIEAGAKAGIFEGDEVTKTYLRERVKKNYSFYYTDSEEDYEKIITLSLEEIEPQVAFPHLPENTKPISEAKGIKIDQVVIGSCTNGRIEDLKIAAEVIKGKKVHKDVRLIVIPGTQKVYLEALRSGILEIFAEAFAVISPPTCGPCLGGHMGVLAKGEKAITTTNRNFIGRMGDPESEVYLANPAVCAASSVAGEICSPSEL